MNDNVLPMDDLGETDPWHGDNSLKLWYFEVGFMDDSIGSIIGWPSIVDWQYWLKLSVWDKKQAALLVLGIDPDKFSPVERHVDYLTICEPLTKLMRLMPENLTRPLEWLTWFNENGYFDCFQASLRQWFREQIEQAQLKPQTEAVGDGGAGKQGSNKKADKLRAEHVTYWVKKTQYTSGKADKTINSALQAKRPDLWGENLDTFRKWMQSDEARSVKHLLPNSRRK